MTLKNKYKLYFILIWVFLFSFLFDIKGQSIKSDKQNKYKTARLAEYAYNSKNYIAAIDLYKKLYEIDSAKVNISYKIAESYFIIRDYKNASVWFKNTYDLDKKLTIPSIEFKYAISLKMDGNYTEAINSFTNFLNTPNNKFDSYYTKQAKKEINNCKFALGALEAKPKVIVDHLDTNLNGINSDFAPVPFDSNKLIFSSLKPSANNKNLIKLYYAQKDSGGNYIYKGLVEEPFNKEDFHTANGSFSPDKKRFYFTRCESENNCKIYCSELTNDKWQEAVILQEVINYPEYSATQPNVVLSSKKQEILFFVSDRPNGYGGYDIWYSTIKNGNEYSQPKNLGEKINTTGDEITPFYDEKSKTLFFSSDQFINFGGFDIFRAKGFLSKWEAPVNVGFPLNSSVDDFNYVITSSVNENGGFLVSNRKGSVNDKNDEKCTCCDDIYRFKFITEPDSITKVIKDTVKIPMDTIANKPELADQTVKTDTILRDNFSNQKNIDENKTYTLKNIYFDFDKSTLLPESMDQLDSLAAILNDIPNAIIEISGYTDTINTQEYNLFLSQNRANSVVAYLTQKGIDKNRLIAKGYGKINPVAPNTNPDGSDNPVGRQLNRRIEFKIIGNVKDSERK
ncbi:MAG: OmpA family protein [Bacteroidetes bacterium]|nr:OmpA family protein [Bacteroidota bacterium]